MKRKIVHIALVVHDYDEAIKFYTEKLDFILVEDTVLSPEKRWVLIKPNEDSECSILLAKAANEAQKLSIGNQTGGRVFLFWKLIIFKKIMTKCLKKALISSENQAKKNTERWQFLKICMGIFGI